MPHSSGGGSHGGGSHGGSHHSGSHGGSSRPSISSRPYPGARRYRYYRHGRYHYFYSSRKGKIFSPARLLLGFVYLPFLIPVGSMLVTPIAKRFQKYDTRIIVKDEANVIKDNSSLENALSDFYKKTHITPAVVTVHNESWQSNYSTLEDYAYDRYLAEFDDEMHWLIVYSEPTAPDSTFNDWYWEGMQGDDTDGVLTTYVTGQFNMDFQERLEANSADLGTNLADSFNVATKLAKKPGILPPLHQIAPALFMLGFLLFHAYFMLGLNELKYRNAELDPDDPNEAPDRFGSQIPVIPQQSFETQQHFGAQPAFGAQPNGSQQAFGAQQTFSAQQQFGMPQSFGTQQAAMPTLNAPPPQPLQTARWEEPEMQPLEMPQNPAPQAQNFLNLPNVQAASAEQIQSQIQPQVMSQMQTQMQAPPVPPQMQQPSVLPQTQPAESGMVEKTCLYCGTRYFKGIKYCPGCGIELTDATDSDFFQ